MKQQIILMRMPNGILCDGPSLEKPIVLESMINVISWVRKEINGLPEFEVESPFKIVK